MVHSGSRAEVKKVYFLIAVLASVNWLTDISARAGASYELGLDEQLRGGYELGVDVELASVKKWTLNVYVDHVTWVRSNNKNETAFRISPEQIYFPVGLKLQYDFGAYQLALVAHHQSNHDIDSTDPQLARETLAYEYYGLEWLRGATQASFGLLYDRGTRLDGTQQNWPFDYFLLGARLKTDITYGDQWMSRLHLVYNLHRNRNADIARTDLGGTIDIGWHFDGKAARNRYWLGLTRLNNYQYLGDAPRNLILFGVDMESLPNL